MLYYMLWLVPYDIRPNAKQYILLVGLKENVEMLFWLNIRLHGISKAKLDIT